MPLRFEPLHTHLSLLAPSALGVVLLGSLPALLPVAQAQQVEAQQARQYDISPGSLGQVLGRFAAESGLLLSGDAGLTDGQLSAGLQGTYGVREALDRLLAGSGVTYRFTDGNTVMLERAAVPAAQSGPVVLDMLTVTGERQEVSLQRTTSSIAVLAEEEIERSDATRVYDAIRSVPNVTPAPPDFLPPIRGVDAGGASGIGGTILTGTTPRAKLIVDDVSRPISYTNNSFQSLFDMEQVEVLRGPQTTLRGSNAIAGAYVIRTKDPVFAVEGEALAEVNWNEFSDVGYRAAGMINGPLVDDQLAARLVVEYEDDRVPVVVYDDGTAPAGTDFEKRSEFDTLGLRSKFLLEPAALPDLRVLLSGEYQTGRDIGFDSWIWGTDYGCCDPEERKYGYSGQQRIFDTESRGVTLNASYLVGDSGELQSITSYYISEFEGTPESNSAVQFEFLDQKRFSQDLIYSFEGVGGFLDGLVGATWSRETDFTDLDGFDFNTDGERTTLAAYTDLTAHVSDRLRVITGGRLQRSRSRFEGDAFGGAAAIDVDQEDNIFLPKLGVALDVAPRQTLLATVRRGYNIGGGGVDFASAVSYEFDPEFVWTYEAGYRGSFNDDRVVLTATAFYNRYRDYQFFYSPNPNTNRILNFDGNTFGLEVEASARVAPTLTLKAGLGLLQTEVDASGEAIDGNDFGKDPDVTLTGGVVWEPRAGLALDATATYVSEYYADFLNNSGTESGDYVNLDLGASYSFDNIKLRGFVRNATDELQYFSRSSAGGSGYVLPPREIGLSVTVEF